MARINAKLLGAIENKTHLSKAQVYARIQQIANRESLPRELAAIRLASEVGVTINKYANAGELSQLRQAGSPVAPPSLADSTQPSTVAAVSKRRSRTVRSGIKRTTNQVFVVHGRDLASRDAVYAFLRALGVKPIEWNSALAMSGGAAPYVADILERAFSKARAVLVLLTPDDLVQLRSDLRSGSDKPYESVPTGQARPNVLFEAGMAFATHPAQTVLVQIGTVKEFSDVGGRHVVHMSNDFAKRQELATKLTNAGCDVDMSGSDWVRAGDFTDPQARAPRRKRRHSRV